MISKIKKIRLSSCDKKWGALVRLRDGVCQYCGSPNYLAAHHLKGRATKATRLLIENGITLCPAHHVFSSKFSAHKTPERFMRWFNKHFPERAKIIKARLRTKMTERQAIREFQERYL